MIRRHIQNASIRHKLTALVLVAVSLALALACGAFATNHYAFATRAMEHQLEALAEVLGANSTAALVFDDAEAAQQVLSSLRKQPIVKTAWIYDADGRLFCAYASSATPAESAAPEKHGVEVSGGHLTVSRTIHDGDERVGSIRLTACLSVVGEQLASYLRIAVLVMCLSLGAALLLALPMQRSLSGPILALARAAERVSENDDYSIRVTAPSGDEIGALYHQFNRMLARVELSERELTVAHDLLEQRVEQRTAQLTRANADLNGEIAERERAERELARTHRELVEAARSAGMAEIATGVLHNVGNVLNSVNISASTIDERLRNPKRRQLDRIIRLMESNRARLGDFLTIDERGRHVPALLSKLAESLGEDDQQLGEEARSLSENIDHIKAIIATQQSFAGSSGLVEAVDLSAVLEDAIRLNATSFSKHEVRVEREFAELPPLVLDKQRLLQIVVNLIKNAKEAVVAQEENERVLKVRTYAEDDRLFIQVVDTGVGIDHDGLARIFNHGYTTKIDGHGFGLHSCANAAREMGGELTAASDGAMRGATFTLDLPLKLKEPANNVIQSGAPLTRQES